MAEAVELRDDRFAAQLRGFGPVGVLAALAVLAGNLLFVPLSALLALAWCRWSQTPWREIGYVRPRSWPLTVAVGVVFGIALKLLLKSVVMPLLGADPINRTFHHLVGNQAALPGMVVLMLLAGFGEETVYRGFLFERLRTLFGTGARAKVLIVLLTSLLFGAAHYPQGRDGILQATLVGLLFGSIFAATGRVWLLIIAHAAFDLTALAIIYWDLETRVAHFVFK